MSRKIDALIAEHVMDIEVQEDQMTYGIFHEKRLNDPIEYFIGETNTTIPHYSTDIKAAWEVVENCPHYMSICSLPNGFSYRARIENTDGNIYINSKADTAPMAICLAALKLGDIPCEDL
jgi:hypothetical protein